MFFFLCRASFHKNLLPESSQTLRLVWPAVILQALLLEDGDDICQALPSIIVTFQKGDRSLEMVSARPFSTPGCILSDPVDFCISRWLKCSLASFIGCRCCFSPAHWGGFVLGEVLCGFLWGNHQPGDHLAHIPNNCYMCLLILYQEAYRLESHGWSSLAFAWGWFEGESTCLRLHTCPVGFVCSQQQL